MNSNFSPQSSTPSPQSQDAATSATNTQSTPTTTKSRFLKNLLPLSLTIFLTYSITTFSWYFYNISNTLKPSPTPYIISHHPKPGHPWILEAYWTEKQLWIPITSYHSSITAFDVRDRLTTGEIQLRDLIY